MSEPGSALTEWPEGLDGAWSEPPRAMLDRLRALDDRIEEEAGWPTEVWDCLEVGRAGQWLLPRGLGGEGCGRADLLGRYAQVGEANLTAAFILTQHDAAVRRLLELRGRAVAARWLEEIGAGRAFTTVGISQLTTSRRRGAAALKAVPGAGSAFRLEGVIPWVTGAAQADVLVVGGVQEDGRQVLAALPTDRAGVTVGEPFELMALAASCTAEVRCEGVELMAEEVLAGPVADVLAATSSGGAGGLETTALALGQTRAAIEGLSGAAGEQPGLAEPAEALARAWRELAADLWRTAEGVEGAPASGALRRRANGLVLQATQAYLAARRGSGFLRDDPAQRWARQAMFFLVWSCPTPVAHGSIRDLAGVCSE